MDNTKLENGLDSTTGLDNTDNINITIVCGDGTRLTCSRRATRLSGLFKTSFETSPNQTEFTFNLLSNSRAVQNIIEYLEHFKDSEPKVLPRPLPSAELKDVCDEWTFNYITNTVTSDIESKNPTEELQMKEQRHIDIMLYANYLQIVPLKDLECARFACNLKKESLEDLKKRFNITKELTPEEETVFRKKHPEYFTWLDVSE